MDLLCVAELSNVLHPSEGGIAVARQPKPLKTHLSFTTWKMAETEDKLHPAGRTHCQRFIVCIGPTVHVNAAGMITLNKQEMEIRNDALLALHC